jgi:hypothetical protein
VTTTMSPGSRKSLHVRSRPCVAPFTTMIDAGSARTPSPPSQPAIHSRSSGSPSRGA